MKLHAYMGDLIQVRGQFNVRVTYKSHTATLPHTVVAGSGPSLMGRNWLTEIGCGQNEDRRPKTQKRRPRQNRFEIT